MPRGARRERLVRKIIKVTSDFKDECIKNGISRAAPLKLLEYFLYGSAFI